MVLIERDGQLQELVSKYHQTEYGVGHCIFISGEAGIGKTSLVNQFCNDMEAIANILRGTCDALFTPRPLAPLYDILAQMEQDFPNSISDFADRTAFFARIFTDLKKQAKVAIIIFEDIHWADEATLDFIKFLARRITQIPCLFLLTYRDNEIQLNHPLRNVLGQLTSGSYTRIKLQPLSRQAVMKMAIEKKYSGEDVFNITGGNPFYVSEVLSNYSLGVPENIKDSILSAYNRTEEVSKQVWELLSVIPSAFEIKYLERIEPAFTSSIESCLQHQILLIKDGCIHFKHELFRRTIEASLSPLRRILLNKKVLELLHESFEDNGEIERIVHHAKNANDYERVVHYAPLAAAKAAAVGAHIEASKLYLSAIEYYQGSDPELLLQLYEGYTYECYLTNQVNEAIVYATKSLTLLKENGDPEKTAACLCLLSRLWWVNDHLVKSEYFVGEAIRLLENQPYSLARARAYALMAHLKMLSDLSEECLLWGNKAIDLAKELSDHTVLSYAMGSVGAILIRKPADRLLGLTMLQQSLDLALQYAFHDCAGMAYTNLAYNGIVIKEYSLAAEAVDAGIPYCDENDLDLWQIYLLAAKAKLKLETGHWNEAYSIATGLLEQNKSTKIIIIFALTILALIAMRRGDVDSVLPRLREAEAKAFEMIEPMRILQSITAFLEYEWLTGQQFIESGTLERTIEMIQVQGNIYGNSEFAFWLQKARGRSLGLSEIYEGYNISHTSGIQRAAAIWRDSGCPYEQAIILFEGTEEDKRKALTIIHELGASAVEEKMKMEMRNLGVKKIPRGIRKSTQENPAQLTVRELEILKLLRDHLQNKEIASRLYISSKTVDHHLSSIFYKLEVNTRSKAVSEAIRLKIIK